MVFRYVPINIDQPIGQDMISSYMKKHLDLSVSFEQVEAIERTKGGKTKQMIDLDTEPKT